MAGQIDVVKALDTSLTRILTDASVDPEVLRRFGFRFTDETEIPDGMETMTELAFNAGWATAMGQVGMLLATLQKSLGIVPA